MNDCNDHWAVANVALANDLGLSDRQKICEIMFFHYKCRKVQTDDCSLDSRIREMIETCKINSPAAATRAPRELYPSLTSSTEQRGTTYFILQIIVATSSQGVFKNQLLKLMLANMMTSISSSCHLTKWTVAGISTSVKLRPIVSMATIVTWCENC